MTRDLHTRRMLGAPVGDLGRQALGRRGDAPHAYPGKGWHWLRPRAVMASNRWRSSAQGVHSLDAIGAADGRGWHAHHAGDPSKLDGD